MRPLLLLVLLCTLFLTLAFVPGSAPAAADATLSALGLQRETPWEKETVTLPAATDKVWKPYLALQKEAGYDMTPYSGKTVTRLRAKIAGHPSGDTVYADIYWTDGKVIGGDIMSTAVGGFMHGLKIPKWDTKSPFVMQMLQKNHN